MKSMIRMGAILAFVVALTGCTGISQDKADLVKIIVVASFVMALFGALVAMFTKQTEQRYVAGLVAFGAGLLGTLFALVLVG
ncbi:MAG: hypothetical protein HY782_05660 [Chloroflexi bacterium]|nr:hypothetical protein [Chloroflexota bacterium]